MLPGYRRRILIEPMSGRVVAELEDDYHRMVVSLDHDGVAVRSVESAMKRSPWTLCPGAIDELAATFTGVALADVARRGGKTRNCTHLYDLATFAAAHAAGSRPVAYDILVTDTIDGARDASLTRDGAALLDWRLADGRFVRPEPVAGRTLFEMGDWIATLDHATAEAARILRWAAIVAMGRGTHMPAGMPATAFPAGSCYNFQPERALRSSRRPGADVDLSAPGNEPMADRASSFRHVASAAVPAI